MNFLLLITVLLSFYFIHNSETKSAYTEEFLAALPPVDFSLANATKTDVHYYLFKNSSQEDALILSEESINKTVHFKTNRSTKIFIHGFTTDPATSPWFNLLKDEYFKKGPHNIFYINWSKAGNLTFHVSAANVHPVGEHIAAFLLATNIPPEYIHIIGHSLGSHLSGFIGKHYYQMSGKKINRITALDPAGPGFEKLGPRFRLSDDDALFVDVIHTDIGYFGATKPIGHVDIYPNGGKNQPGCPSRDVDDNCSHARSTLFFVESVNHVSRGRKGRFDLELKKVVADENEEDNDVIVFGDGISHLARGIYILETNSSPPFLIAN